MHSNYNILENYNSQKIQNSYNSPTGAPVNDSNVGNPPLVCRDMHNNEQGTNCIPLGGMHDGPDRIVQPCPPECPYCSSMFGASFTVNVPMGSFEDPERNIPPTLQYLVAGQRSGKCIQQPQQQISRPVAGNRHVEWSTALITYENEHPSPDVNVMGGLSIPGSANAICSNFKDEFIYWQNQYQTIMSQGWQPELNASVGLPSTGGVNKMCLLHQEGGAQTASCDGLDKQIFLQTARLNMAFARDNFEQCTRMVRDKSPVCSNASVAPLLCTTDLVQQSSSKGSQTSLKTDDIKKIADGGNRPVATITINKEDGWWGVPPLPGPLTTASPNQSRASINNYFGGILLPSAVRRCRK